jgi:cytochrome P450
MLGSLRRMLLDPLGYLSWARDEYGPVTAFAVSDPPAVLLSHPDDVRQVLVANHRAYTKRTVQYDTLATVTGDGLLVSDPPLWTRRRRMVQPGFHHSGLDAVARHTVAAATTEAERIVSAGGSVDIDEAMMHTALQVVGAALFSTDLAGQASALVPAVLTALDRVVVRARSPWLPPPSVPTPGNRRLAAALTTIDATVQAMVVERRRAGEPGDDVLGMLLGERLDALTPEDLAGVRNEVVTLLIAGHETVASALTWTWHLLTTHPDAYARVLAEVDALDRPPSGLADLARLTFTRAVLDEALRLFPPAWVITRRVAEPDVLGGYRVDPGTLVLISTYALHRDPLLWPDPDEFRPERWQTGHQRGPRWSYLPFGAGTRQCIGKDFALVEGVLVLATVARHLVLRRPVDSSAPRVQALVTLRPKDGLSLDVHRRLMSAL